MLEKPTNQVSTLETHKSFSAPTLKFYPNIRIMQIMHVNRNANWKAEKLNGQLLLSPSSASLAFDDGGSLMCPFHLLIVLWLIKFSVEHSLELLPSGIAWTLGFFTHCCSQKAFKVRYFDENFFLWIAFRRKMYIIGPKMEPNHLRFILLFKENILSTKKWKVVGEKMNPSNRAICS